MATRSLTMQPELSGTPTRRSSALLADHNPSIGTRTLARRSLGTSRRCRLPVPSIRFSDPPVDVIEHVGERVAA